MQDRLVLQRPRRKVSSQRSRFHRFKPPVGRVSGGHEVPRGKFGKGHAAVKKHFVVTEVRKVKMDAEARKNLGDAYFLEVRLENPDGSDILFFLTGEHDMREVKNGHRFTFSCAALAEPAKSIQAPVLLSVQEFGKRLGGISPATIYTWLSLGKFGLIRTKIGSRTMIAETELAKVIGMSKPRVSRNRLCDSAR